MTPAVACAVGILAVLAGGMALTLVLERSYRLAYGIAVATLLAGFGLAVCLAVKVVADGVPAQATLAELPAFKGTVSLYADRLTLLLVLMLLFVGSLSAVFSFRYIRALRRRPAGRFYSVFLLLVLSMGAVLLAGDLLMFFAAWELMSLPAFLLIMHEDRRPEKVRAGMKYLILNGVGGIGMLLAVLMIYPHADSFSFADTRQALGAMMVAQPWLANLVLALMTLAFATKAGLFPTGDWLPDAHGEAPAPVSVLLSGIMIKLGAYGALRVFLWLLPAEAMPPGWLLAWGMVLATWGAASIMLGSSAAVVSNHSKRLLAYSSVSQSGYIFLGLGVGVAALHLAPTVATLALIGCGVHIMVDALHKSALFMVSGSVAYRTGTEDINRLGGLEGRMPVTTLTAAAGVLSLAGLPFTGAFVSKWLIIQSTLWMGREHALFLAYVVVALLGSVLAVAYGLKYVGAIFLGPESELVSRVEEGEVPRHMGVPPALLVACSFVVGLVPVVLIGPVIRALPAPLAAIGPRAFGQVSLAGLVPLVGGSPAAAFSPLWLVALLALVVVGAWLWSRSGGAAVRATEGWACGEQLLPDELRPRAAGYFWALSSYLARIYSQIGLPTFAAPQQPWDSLESDRWAFDRVSRLGWALAHRIARLQTGVAQHYVLWQLLGALIIAAIVLLVAR